MYNLRCVQYLQYKDVLYLYTYLRAYLYIRTVCNVHVYVITVCLYFVAERKFHDFCTTKHVLAYTHKPIRNSLFLSYVQMYV